MKTKLCLIAFVAFSYFSCKPINDPDDKNPLIGTWESSFEYENPYMPGEYRVADEFVRFVSNNRMIYESVDDMSEFPDEALYVFRLSHKEFSYEMTNTTLTLSYLPNSSYRDNITPGDKDLPRWLQIHLNIRPNTLSLAIQH